MLRQSVAAGAAAAGFGFNQENAARADGYMVNVPIFFRWQIVKCAKAAVRCFRQHFGHGLFATDAKTYVFCLFEPLKRPQRRTNAARDKRRCN